MIQAATLAKGNAGPVAAAATTASRVVAALMAVTLVGGLIAGESLSSEPASPFIPRDATVVLLAGLPGDLESENLYTDQVRSWLQVFNRLAGSVRRMHVLCDNPGAITNGADSYSPEGSKVDFARSSKQSFLSLAKTISGNESPLMLIAWGHGGRQGTVPVLHVRGERLTPEDFVAMAPKKPGVPSRWVLMFRTSGAFASRLAGVDREIIASEGETAFTSDPIGMAVLLEILGKDPLVSFRSLSDQFGSLVVQWYEERHLARTEDPLLWAGRAEPRLLAGARNEIVAAARENAGLPGREEPSTPNPVAETKPDLVSTNLPDHWTGIHRVDPRNYPEYDGVVLSRKLSFVLGSNPAVSSEHDQYIQLLTAEGKHLADFDVSFTPPFEELTFLDCELLQPGGKLVRLDANAIRETRDQSIGDYQFGSRKFFSLPGAGPNAILHVRYRTTQKTYPLPHFSLALPLADELPIVSSALSITVPKDAAFHFAVENADSADPSIKQGSYGTTYGWSFTNMPGRNLEPLSPPVERPQLLVSTFPDWRALSQWYARITEFADDMTPEIKTKAIELTAGARTDLEKIAAVYNCVAGLRYVAVPLGINSLRPHAAANVFANQFGDCKDKANLFNTLLGALNIRANLVLVPRFSKAMDSLPGFTFNHAISRVILGNETLWIDTTDDVCRFGMLPPGDAGRKVLVIDGQTAGLSELPFPQAKDHALSVHSSLVLSGPGLAASAVLDARARGFPDYSFRMAAREGKARFGSSNPLLAGLYRPSAGSFALQRQTATAASALTEDFSLSSTGVFHGICSVAADTNQMVLHGPCWLPREWDLALHARKATLYLSQGYPLSLDQQLTFTLPEKTQIISLPAMRENPNPPLRWKIEWQQPSAGKLVARFTAELERGELSPSDTRLFQEQLATLQSVFAAPVMIGNGNANQR